MIPFIGLILGPVSLLLGIIAWRRRLYDPDRGRSPAIASIILGSLITITNWAGLWLMLTGLRE